MKSSSTGFSLVELLVALGILSISILTIIGLIPVLIEAHQGSKELVRGKNLVEEIMVDLKGLSLGNKKRLFTELILILRPSSQEQRWNVSLIKRVKFSSNRTTCKRRDFIS